MGLDMYLYCNSRPMVQEIHKDSPYGDYITDWYRKTGVAVYWRKANAIHKWFVDNVQDGKDDCGIYEVEFEQLKRLRDTCKKVLDGCKLVDGKVRNGSTWQGGEWIDIYEQGKVMTNAELAHELLPTQAGFFFGSQDYDQYYYEDIKWTYEQLDLIIKRLYKVEESFWSYAVHPYETDWYVTFHYHSSW